MGEISWRHKLSTLWLREGDIILFFLNNRMGSYHSQFNHVKSIEIDGEPIIREEELRQGVVQYYEHLFKEEQWRPMTEEGVVE